MADRLPNRPPRTNWGNLSKNLALWLLVGLLALFLFQMMSRQRNPTQEFSYTEFSKQLDQGNVAGVEVFDGKRLEGDFRSPVTQDGRSAKSFQVLLPVANSEAFIKRLEDAKVPILAKEPKGGITAIIIAALPWIVILGLWFFLLRQLQAGGSRAFAFGKSKAKLLGRHAQGDIRRRGRRGRGQGRAAGDQAGVQVGGRLGRRGRRGRGQG